MKKQTNYYYIYNSCGMRAAFAPIVASNVKEAIVKAKELTKNIYGHYGLSRSYNVGGLNARITWY